ncbi:hypothetical protein BC834DRAFT_1017933 [Gloeopeniophorella convolvens]|nr:hypothetical protein BC834DRAFT_1017933 [Gloeopeniophorella convolvens]
MRSSAVVAAVTVSLALPSIAAPFAEGMSTQSSVMGALFDNLVSTLSSGINLKTRAEIERSFIDDVLKYLGVGKGLTDPIQVGPGLASAPSSRRDITADQLIAAAILSARALEGLD